MIRVRSEPRVVIGPEEIPHGFNTHVQIPTPFLKPDGSLAILVSCRDRHNRSFTFQFVLDPETFRIHERPKAPIFDLGKPGTFDSRGIMPSHVVSREGAYYLYYIGWNVPTDVPFHNCIGLAISKDGDKFERYSEGPILDRNIHDPYFVSTPFLHPEAGKIIMYYLSGLPWREFDGQLQSSYDIRAAKSNDGIHFEPQGEPVISLEDEEWALARPWIYHATTGESKMLFCARRSTYSLCSATKREDGWIRDESPFLCPSGGSGPFSDNVAYPALINYRKKNLVFCNGNGFGQTGVLMFEID